MDTNYINDQAKKLITDLRSCSQSDIARFNGLFAKAKEFLRVYAGPNSEFYKGLDQATSMGYLDTWAYSVADVLNEYVNYVEAGLLTGVSAERKIQLDIVSDYLEQATNLLNEKDVHPAAPAVIIGASLEEFLRNWVEAEGLGLGNQKPSINSYATILKAAEFITKQDVKDITSWAGLRNNAAHGKWEEVENRDYVRLVLEGVNLFMRKYGDPSAA